MARLRKRLMIWMESSSSTIRDLSASATAIMPKTPMAISPRSVKFNPFDGHKTIKPTNGMAAAMIVATLSHVAT